MIHYHGSPMGNKIDAVRFFAGRHGMVSFYYPDEINVIAEVCQSFVLDNGAYSAWRKGLTIDFDEYTKWVQQWHRHPGFDFCLIPDKIDGSTAENDDLLSRWPRGVIDGCPVWHLHEPIERLVELCNNWKRVAFGSSGVYSTPGHLGWWRKMTEAMGAICDDEGRPPTKLHGLRMLDPEIFTALPLASADSTNAVVNSGGSRWAGPYRPISAAQRADVIADRVESRQSAPVWFEPPQRELALQQSPRWLKDI